MKLCAGDGLQQADHRRDDAALLDELDLPRKCRGRVAVEPDNEPALNLQTRALDALHVGDQVALLVLALGALCQARFLRGLELFIEHALQQGNRFGSHDPVAECLGLGQNVSHIPASLIHRGP